MLKRRRTLMIQTQVAPEPNVDRVVITGEGNATKGYVTIDGTSYSSAAVIELEKGQHTVQTVACEITWLGEKATTSQYPNPIIGEHTISGSFNIEFQKKTELFTTYYTITVTRA